jgi:hypothetical protein
VSERSAASRSVSRVGSRYAGYRFPAESGRSQRRASRHFGARERSRVRKRLPAGAKRIRTLGPTRVRHPRQPQGSLPTPRWREMDSNFSYRDTRAPDAEVPRASRVARAPERAMLAAGCTTVIGGPLHRGFVQSASAIVAIDPGRCRVSTLQQRSDIPEEQIWLDWTSRRARTRAARTGSTCSTSCGRCRSRRGLSLARRTTRG